MRLTTNKIWVWLLFILSPFLSLVFAIKSFRSSWAKNGLWAFAIFYGFTFVISNEGMDAFVYAQKLSEMHQQSLGFGGIVTQFYQEEGQSLDFIQPLLTYLVSIFTDNYHVLYGVFCIVFGFFFSRNIWLVIDTIKGRMPLKIVTFIVLFSMIIPLWSVNGVRMNTAAHIFFYGAFPYLLYGNKKYLMWCILSIFMHFSFIFPVIILGVFIFSGNRINVYFWLFVASAFFIESGAGRVTELMQSYLPDIFKTKLEGYTNTEYGSAIAEKFSENNLYAIWYEPVLRWSLTLMLILIYWKGKQFQELNPWYKLLLGFTFLIYSMSNLVAGIPSFGRFLSVSSMFGVVCIIYYLRYAILPSMMKSVMPLIYAASLFYIIVSIRIGFDTIGLMTIIGNPITALFDNTEMPLIDFLK